MIQAEQNALLQDTSNFIAINIRAAELNYYSTWYMSFGNQAILLAGFVLSSYSQVVPQDVGTTLGDRFGNLYWVNSML